MIPWDSTFNIVWYKLLLNLNDYYIQSNVLLTWPKTVTRKEIIYHQEILYIDLQIFIERWLFSRSISTSIKPKSGKSKGEYSNTPPALIKFNDNWAQSDFYGSYDYVLISSMQL